MSISWFSSKGLDTLRRDYTLRYELTKMFKNDVKRAFKSVNIEIDEKAENEIVIKLLGSAYKAFMLGCNTETKAS